MYLYYFGLSSFCGESLRDLGIFNLREAGDQPTTHPHYHHHQKAFKVLKDAEESRGSFFLFFKTGNGLELYNMRDLGQTPRRTSRTREVSDKKTVTQEHGQHLFWVDWSFNSR